MTNTITDQATVTGVDPLHSVTEMADLITGAVRESVALRRAPDDVIAELHARGITRISWPHSRGGAQLSVTQQVQVLKALGELDGSTAWVTAIYIAMPYMVHQFGQHVFDQFLDSDTPYSAGVFSVTGTATSVPGGYRLTGTWPFCSGQHHAGWIFVPANPEDGGPPIAALIPRSEFRLAGAWDLTGLIGTGSNALSLTDAFVPDGHVISFQNILEGKNIGPGVLPHYYEQPIVPIICAHSAGPAVGMATAALGTFKRRIHTRPITYSHHGLQADAEITARHLADAQALIDEAEWCGRRAAQTVDHHVATGKPWDISTRVRCRFDGARAVKLCRDACDIIEKASGASARREGDPLMAILRDIHALSLHAFLHYDTVAEAFGEVLAGKTPSYPVY
ncbi:acyl-CoA dehydrogenase family protein [Nocardia sp. NPDC058499]|uniref:acyl-CoA dehydrogenase family protein n=1 Tax=Nocardia sp. NPDC058499 TaxID=3346530 RepID=UPI003655F31E